MAKPDTKKDIDESLKKSGVDKRIKEQVELINKGKRDHR